MTISYNKGFSIAAMFMAIAAFFGIGVHVANNMQATTTDSTAVQMRLSDKQITDVALAGLTLGKDNQPDPSIKVNVNKIVRGDLNGDGTEDAVVIVNQCGADCGTLLEIVINDNGAAKRVVTNASGKASDSPLGNSGIVGVEIKDNGQFVVINQAKLIQPGMSPSQTTDWFKLQGNQLISLNTTNPKEGDLSASYNSTNPNMSGGLNANSSGASASGWRTYSDTLFSVKYPSDWKASQVTTTQHSVVFVSPLAGPSNVSNFQIECSPITTTVNPDALIALYIKHFGDKLSKNGLTIDGLGATEMSFSDDSVPIHGSKILVSKNEMMCDIMENGKDYYQSPEFISFYNSFKFTNN